MLFGSEFVMSQPEKVHSKIHHVMRIYVVIAVVVAQLQEGRPLALVVGPKRLLESALSRCRKHALVPFAWPCVLPEQKCLEVDRFDR